jgi:sulfite reductase beta subunit-like hemoprotein
MSTWKKLPIIPAQEVELKRFEQEISALQHGGNDPEDFKRFCRENGVYGIRNSTDRHMIRVKIRYGALTADQLECLADASEEFTPLRIAHITTRQDLQFHNVEQRRVPALMRLIAESGLTSREACGNTVRNVTACQFAGIAADEVFDVTPHAAAVNEFLLRNPVCQNMPRKFKIAFEGCPADHARLGINDFGAQAVCRDGRRGFRISVGGGLGVIPASAQLLEEFTPEEWLLASVEAAIRLFDRHGNRKDRARARLKFIIKDWGIDEFRKQWLAERQIVLSTQSGASVFSLPAVTETAPALPTIAPVAAPETPAYRRWLATNCVAQKQAGYFAVSIRCLLGDVTVAQMRAVAGIARRYCGGRVRTTITQNMTLRWIPAQHLPNVHAELTQAVLGAHEAEHLADVTRCPGADTCQLAITHSRGLAEALGELFANGLAQDPVLQDLTIKISGCPNSCGQHQIADLGFTGTSKTIDGHAVAHYRLLLGGRTGNGGATFGVPVVMLPSKRITSAVTKLLGHYKATRTATETFHDFVQRVGVPALRQLLEEFTTLPPHREQPELYGDIGWVGEFSAKG